jgi:hypothetical protein
LEPVPEPGPLPVRFRVVVSLVVPGPVPGVPVLGVVVAAVEGLMLLVPGVPGPAVPVPVAAAPGFPVARPFIALLVSIPAAGTAFVLTSPLLIPAVVSELLSPLLQPATASTAASASMLLPVIAMRMTHSFWMYRRSLPCCRWEATHRADAARGTGGANGLPGMTNGARE